MTYVAFLRGINVGGRIVKMADLRACFESLGFGQVTTYLQTGNVVFDAAEQDTGKLEALLEVGISKFFSFQARSLVRTLHEVQAYIVAYPFDAQDEASQHYTVLLKLGVNPHELAAEPADDRIEAVYAGKGVVYWRVQKGMTLKSTFSKQLVKTKYKEFHTNRNLKTLQKIIG